ncbi:hypothetical protein ARMSODRAFT_1016586 [Armillaria solidipes]|uniref:Uncharacterized protein n=1 Tax=Armillaria solidipes TaxID=1076256 RepID=A0A2H3C620_9AGAR|nr:hypothetical protein ARMSODRAFT_1016586 [Armillaria solidipes]
MLVLGGSSSSGNVGGYITVVLVLKSVAVVAIFSRRDRDRHYSHSPALPSITSPSSTLHSSLLPKYNHSLHKQTAFSTTPAVVVAVVEFPQHFPAHGSLALFAIKADLRVGGSGQVGGHTDRHTVDILAGDGVQPPSRAYALQGRLGSQISELANHIKKNLKYISPRESWPSHYFLPVSLFTLDYICLVVSARALNALAEPPEYRFFIPTLDVIASDDMTFSTN